MRCYAFQFCVSERTVNYAEQNKKSKKFSIAGIMNVFPSKELRDKWICAGPKTSSLPYGSRKAVSLHTAKILLAGKTDAEFNSLSDEIYNSNLLCVDFNQIQQLSDLRFADILSRYVSKKILTSLNKLVDISK